MENILVYFNFFMGGMISSGLNLIYSEILYTMKETLKEMSIRSTLILRAFSLSQQYKEASVEMQIQPLKLSSSFINIADIYLKTVFPNWCAMSFWARATPLTWLEPRPLPAVADRPEVWL